MKLGFFDLLQPSFGMGLFINNTFPAAGYGELPNAPGEIVSSIPSAVRDLLSVLSVEELHTAYDETATVYYGRVQIDGDGLAENSPTYRAPSGNVIEPRELGFHFRITFPRVGSGSLSNDLNTVFNGLSGTNQTNFGDLRTVLNRLGSTGTGVANMPSDFPSKNFKIELLFNSIILHLPKDDFLPARLAADGWLEHDPNFDDVSIHLPKIAMVITQNADDYGQASVEFAGWGIDSLDEAGDLAAGELISMRPALCLHKSSVLGFGVEKVILDLSRDFTPVEILENNFGVGDEFRGLWMPQVRFFLAPSGLRGFAFDTWGKDLLIDFDQGLSGEIGAELVSNYNRAPLEVDVVFYEGSTRKSPTRNNQQEDANHNITRNSRISTTTNAEIQLRIRGGRPPYHINITRNGTAITGVPYEGDARRLRYPLAAPNPGSYTVSIRVEDNLSPTHRFWQEAIAVTCRGAGATGNSSPQVQAPQLNMLTGAPAFLFRLADNQPENDAIFIRSEPDQAAITVGGNEILRRGDGTYRISAQRDGTHIMVSGNWPTSGTPEHFQSFNPNGEIGAQISGHGENLVYLRMDYDHPRNQQEVNSYIDSFYNNTSVRAAFDGFLARRNGRDIHLYGYASYERHNDTEHVIHNIELSQRRVEVLRQLLLRIDSTLPIVYSPATDARGAEVARANTPPSGPADTNYHVAIAVYTTQLPPASPNTATAEVWRPADVVNTPQSTAEPSPAPTEPERPSSFRRLGIRVRFQRNQLVFAELFGEFDVIDEARQQGQMIQSADVQNGNSVNALNSAISTAPGASQAPETPENQGVVDFKINMLYDTATQKLTQTLAFGFDRNNARDGFVNLQRFEPHALADTMASLLLFAPLIQGGIEAIQNAESDEQRTQAITIATAEIGVATLLGLFAIKMQKVTLFGVELSVSEISPDIAFWNAQQVTEIGVLFDYAVDFRVDLNLFNVLTIRTKENDPSTGRRLLPPRARYKAIGMKFDINPTNGAVRYIPIFDASKGYELSLGDPGALEVMVGGTSLNNLLRVLSARVSKENPMIFEADLALNINLGIISVDTLRVRLRIYNENNPVRVVPEIIPTKVSVNIPGALTGVGYLDFGNSSSSGQVAGSTGGFRGFVDVTVVPVKLRIAASLGIQPLNEGGREATAFFLGLEVELPAGIPLGSTGLGIFGFLGLFAMHYKRLEPPEQPGQLPPALSWFYQTVHGNVIDITGWGPQLDKWSFGVGIILGTMEGGFVLNLKGMFILELPGPRILIFVKASLLFPKPSDVKAAGQNQSVGILAVLDLDFNIGRMTIGIIIEYNIESVLSLRVPVVAQFPFNQPENWFIDIGSNLMPAEALILGIVRGYAYLMVHGNGIPNWPTPGVQKLYGFSLAVGLGASIVFGDRDSGLYLEVRGDFAAGIGFSPFHFYGFLELKGQLNLWIVSIAAWARLEVEGPDPHTYIHGKACGKVSFFFFSIEGCVDIEINDAITVGPPPDLLTSLTLVSRSSALMAGQGVDRPIDGSLGKAAIRAGGTTTGDIPIVPIDSIPVLNLFATPDVNGCTTFTDPISPSSTYTQDGWVNTSGTNKVRYQLKSLSLSGSLSDNSKPKPVNFWKKPTDNLGDEESSVDMALLCWSPDPTPRALQRSKELTTKVTKRWEIVCKQIAPATSVLYTFNQKPLGYSSNGWHLEGIAWPDPPNTIRSKPADTSLYVFENRLPDDLPLLQEIWLAVRGTIIDHAKVIGRASNPGETIITVPRPKGKALKFPSEMPRKVNSQPTNLEKIPGETLSAIKQFEPENIIIDAGEIVKAEILLVFNRRVIGPENIRIRTIAPNKEVIVEKTVADYGFTVVNSASDLPPQWLNPEGTWRIEVNKVLNFINDTFKGREYTMVLVHYQGEPGMRYIQMLASHQQGIDTLGLILGIIETLAAAEYKREEHDYHTKDSEKDTLSDALTGEPLRALLKPNTEYELTVNYAYQRKTEEDLVDANFADAPAKTFVFRTDDKAPLRMDPWVLTCIPQNDMRYHFKNDPVQIYLNDESVIQLYKAYGITLEAKVNKANGVHPLVEPDKMILDPSNISQFGKVQAAIKTPYLHTLEEVVQAELPCINDSGIKEEHVVFTIGVEMLLNTEYTVEIIKSGDTIDPASNSYRTPLYKMAFRTSRYQDAAEFAAMIGKAYSKTLVLKANLGSLPEECTDNEMQSILLNAGLPALPAASNIGVYLLWSAVNAGGTLNSRLEAILIDTPEPLWRKRPYPVVETVQSESGPMKHWVMQDKLELELVETGTSVVERLVRTQGGSRTLIYLKTTAAGNPIRLQLKKHNFTHIPEHYGTAATLTLFDALQFSLPSVAPWAEED